MKRSLGLFYLCNDLLLSSSWLFVMGFFFFWLKGVWRWDMRNSWWWLIHQRQHTTHKLHNWDTGSSSEESSNTCRKHYIYLSSLHSASLDKRQEHMLDRHNARNRTQNLPDMRPMCYQKYTKILEKTHRANSVWVKMPLESGGARN